MKYESIIYILSKLCINENRLTTPPMHSSWFILSSLISWVGLQRKFRQFCSCLVVGGYHVVHCGLRRQRARHVEGQDYGFVLCNLWNLILRLASWYPWLRICIKSSATTTSKTHEQEKSASRHFNTGSRVILLFDHRNLGLPFKLKFHIVVYFVQPSMQNVRWSIRN